MAWRFAILLISACLVSMTLSKKVKESYLYHGKIVTVEKDVKDEERRSAPGDKKSDAVSAAGSKRQCVGCTGGSCCGGQCCPSGCCNGQCCPPPPPPPAPAPGYPATGKKGQICNPGCSTICNPTCNPICCTTPPAIQAPFCLPGTMGCMPPMPLMIPAPMGSMGNPGSQMSMGCVGPMGPMGPCSATGFTLPSPCSPICLHWMAIVSQASSSSSTLSPGPCPQQCSSTGCCVPPNQMTPMVMPLTPACMPTCAPTCCGR